MPDKSIRLIKCENCLYRYDADRNPGFVLVEIDLDRFEQKTTERWCVPCVKTVEQEGKA